MEREGGAEVLPTDQFDGSVDIVLHGPPRGSGPVRAGRDAGVPVPPAIVDVEAVDGFRESGEGRWDGRTPTASERSGCLDGLPRTRIQNP